MLPGSFSQRIPIEVSLIVLVTGLAIAGSVLWHDYRALRTDVSQNAERFSRILSQALAADIKTHGIWHAYQTLSSLYQGAEPSWLQPAFALVLDPTGRTWAASDPVRFPLAEEPRGLGLDRGLTQARGLVSAGTHSAEVTKRGWIYHIEPVQEGERVLGTLVLAFSQQALWPRFNESAVRVLLTTGTLLLLLLPVSWWLGRRIARPLLELERCVARIGQQDMDTDAGALDCPTPAPYRELDLLRRRIEAVDNAMRQQRTLEAQIIRSERQAALGRLAAGIAHEINNPLGGMLTAIAMYKRHGRDEHVTRQTLSLMERGLDQIRHTVSALLVEVRAEPRRLSPSDVNDIADLIAPQIREKRVNLDLDNRLTQTLDLPAGPVRQILLNLALNAAQAAPLDSTVSILVEIEDRSLHLIVANNGEAIAEQQMRSLFEPFTADGPQRLGLGLWVTDQTVRQLNGHIQVRSTQARTAFDVLLPLGATA